VDQKGSLVAPEKLRFDFSHKTGVTDSELRKIEDISTQYIRYVDCEGNTDPFLT
jgi:alanyl-tRNA synthetase